MADCDFSRLARRAKRQREPLGGAEAPDAIPAERVVGRKTTAASSGGGGLVSPLTELETTPTEIYQYASSDGFFVFARGRETTYVDAVGTLVTFIADDPAT